MSSYKPITFFHGGRIWYGDFEIKPKSSKVMEHGPGLYLTNGIETARHYAKGGGVVQAIQIDPNASLLEHKKTDINEMMKFLAAAKVKNREKIALYLNENAIRYDNNNIPLETLVNLMINLDALMPSVAPSLNEFIIQQGVDISVFNAPMWTSHGQGNDQWMVVYNPKVVMSKQQIDMKKFDWSNTHLPRYEKQLEVFKNSQIAQMNSVKETDNNFTLSP